MATQINVPSKNGLMQRKYVDKEEQEEDLKQQQIDISMHLPAKEHLNKLENQILDLIKEIETDKKNIQILRSEITSVGHLNNEQCADISRFTMDEIIRQTKDLRQIQSIEQNETTLLKQQLNSLTQDRIKLQQNALVLENQIYEAEKDLGYKRFGD